MYYNYNGRIPQNPPVRYDTPKRRILTEIRKTSNGLGFFVFSYFLLMQFGAVSLYILLGLLGVSDSELSGSSISRFLLDTFVLVFASFVPCIFYFPLSNRKMSDTVKMGRVRPSVLISLVCMGMSVAAAANAASSLVADNFSIFGLKNTAATAVEAYTPVQMVMYIISTAVVPAFAEEFAFRGVILGVLRRYGDAFAIIASSVVFAAMHGNISQIPFTFIFALALAYSVCASNSLLPSIIIHFLNNLYAVAMNILKCSGISGSVVYMIYFSLNLVFCALGILAFILSLEKNRRLYAITDRTGVTAYDVRTVNISFKEKNKYFFTSVGIIFSLSIFLVETICNLGV